MRVNPLGRILFSEHPGWERAWRLVFLFAILIMFLLLYLFWTPLRDTERTYALVSLTVTNRPLLVFFQGVTILGSEGFFLVFLSVLYWSVNRTVGFWGLIVMPLSILVTSEIPKDLIRLPRPDVPGVSVPTYTFPSGHSSGAVSVWGYLAVKLRNRYFWCGALFLVFLVGVSRVLLGYHFPGDVLGGFISGALFLAFFFQGRLSFRDITRLEKQPRFLAFMLALGLPLAMSFLPVTYAPNLTGYLAGALTGHLLASDRLPFSVQGNWFEHLARGVIGLLVIAFLFSDYVNSLLGYQPILVFFRHGLATFWAVFLAPLLFLRLGLSRLEDDTCK